ncbi:MAG: Bug family tripartite tricarboxylate transporter substrate binding protein [Burkholderiales bacterium]
MLRTFFRSALWVVMMMLPLAGSALDYPSKPVTMIVAFPPGGPTDLNARLFARSLSDDLGKPVVVQNKPGAGGSIGARAAAAAEADGHTIFYNTTAVITSQALQADPDMDPAKVFVPVALTVAVPLVLVATPSMPVKNVRDLIQYASAHAGKLNYSSAGTGTITHLAPALFALQSGIRAQHVPYKGSAPALAALSSGEIQFAMETLNTLLPFLSSGRIRALAFAGAKRHPAIPEVPTLTEALGSANFEISAWQGIVVPARTPNRIVARLNAAINKAINDPILHKRLMDTGSEPLGGSTQQYAAFMVAEHKRWTRVVRESGITAE